MSKLDEAIMSAMKKHGDSGLQYPFANKIGQEVARALLAYAKENQIHMGETEYNHDHYVVNIDKLEEFFK